VEILKEPLYSLRSVLIDFEKLDKDLIPFLKKNREKVVEIESEDVEK
jgi:hypothetical protein